MSVTGDVLLSNDLSIYFIGCDVVVSALDLDFPPHAGSKYHSQSATSIITAMRTAKVTRFICISAWFVLESSDESFLHRWFYRPFVKGRTLDDMAKMEDYLRTECSDINYTVVRPPKLTDEGLKRATVVCKRALFVAGTSDAMPRQNLAKYIVDILADRLTYKIILAIGLIAHHSQESKSNQNNNIT